MKRWVSLLLFIILSSSSIFYGNNADYTITVNVEIPKEPTYRIVWSMEDLGIPSAMSYNKDLLTSRNPWDMILFNGKLYIGGGDYGDNTGPVTVWRYDINTSSWENSGIVNDEAVARFHIVGDNLVISGTDPKEDHELGSYYVLNNDVWETVRKVPFAAHIFDIAEYQNETFYAIGTSKNKQSPVQKTTDGENFINIPFYNKDTEILSNKTHGYSRCYALFKVDNRLFAFCRWYSGIAFGNQKKDCFYEYKDGAFYSIEDITKICPKTPGVNRQNLINEWVTINDTCYISLGNVYVTKNFKELNILNTPNGEYVQDIAEFDGKTYMISSKKIEIMPKEEPKTENTSQTETSSEVEQKVENKTKPTTEDKTNTENDNENNTETVPENKPEPIIKYKNTIWEYSETDGFKEVYSFKYDSTAMSLVVTENVFYIGIGNCIDQSADQSQNGKIIKIEQQIIEE